MTLFLFFVLLFALSCGIEQGMAMTYPLDPRTFRVRSDGVQCVRAHIWFDWYHILVLGVRLSAVMCGVTFPAASAPFYLGAGVIWWALFEAAYSYSRWLRLYPVMENWFGTGRYIKGRALTIWVWARLTGGLIFLILGGLS